MAETYVTYVSDGSTTIYTFAFEYIDKDFVKVEVDGSPVGFTLTGTYQVTLDASPVVGSVIQIKRQTDTEQIVSFQAGSVLLSRDLNIGDLQAIHIAAEARDAVDDAMALDGNGAFDARTRRITNLADPIEDTDAVTRGWVQEPLTATLDAANASADRAEAAAAMLEDIDAVGVERVYNTVADMLADSAISVGDVVSTRGYFSPGDGGHLEYIAVPNGTGTVDGGEFHFSTAAGLQLKGLFSNSIRARCWGMPTAGDASGRISAMMDWIDATFGSPSIAIKLIFEGTIEIANQIMIGVDGTGVTKTMSVDAKGAIFKVITGGNLESTGDISAIYLKNLHRSVVEFSQILCDHICGGITVENCSNCFFPAMHFHQFTWRGLWVKGKTSVPEAGNSSGSVFNKVTGAEWTSGESEFGDNSNFVSDGIVNDSHDVRFTNAHIGWCSRAIVNNAGSCEYIACHPFNGNADDPSASEHRICFWNEGGGNVNIYDMYGDNGYVVDNQGGLNIDGLEMLDYNSVMTEPYIRIRTDAGSLAGVMQNVRAPLGFFTGEFNPSFSNADTSLEYDPMAAYDPGTVRRFTRKEVRYKYGNSTPDTLTIKQDGGESTEIVEKYVPGAGDVRVRFKGNAMTVQAGSTSGGEVRTSSATKTGIETTSSGDNLIFNVNNAEGARFESSGNFKPGSDGTQNLGLFNRRWNQIFGKTARFTDLPTSATGLTVGDLWRDGDVVKIKT